MFFEFLETLTICRSVPSLQLPGLPNPKLEPLIASQEAEALVRIRPCMAALRSYLLLPEVFELTFSILLIMLRKEAGEFLNDISFGIS